MTIRISRDDFESACYEADIDVTGDEEGAVVRWAYSGRAMYGATCPAIVAADSSPAVKALVMLALKLNEEGKLGEVLRLADAMCTDNLGLGVVTYFPELVLT